MLLLLFRPLLNPPMYISNENRQILYELKNNLNIANTSVTKKGVKDQLFEVLSNIVQDQIFELQQQKNCSQTNIICGHKDGK